LKTGKYFSLALLVIFSNIFLSAQETGNDINRTFEKPDSVYVIREIEFDVIGRSRPFALISSGNFKEGERIKGKDNFVKYIALKKQLLVNQQVLEEVMIEYFTGESESDGALPVKLLVHVRDTWNLIILPYPKYDSNEGFSITLKARDYNFFGTMSALRVDLGYQNNNGEQSVNFSLESDVPFEAAGLNWILNFDHFFFFFFNEPLYYQNVTGLSLLLPCLTTIFTTGFNQYLTINEENSDENIEIYDLD
jgi:outer membrane protein assembly factor BamA